MKKKMDLTWLCLIFILPLFVIGPIFISSSSNLIAQVEDRDISLSEMRPVLERFAADRSSLTRYYNVPMSDVRIERMKEFFLDWQKELGKLNFQEMSVDGKIDYLLFKNLLEYGLRGITYKQSNNKEIAPLVPFWKGIVKLEEDRLEMTRIDPEEIAARLTHIYSQIVNAREGIEIAQEDRSNSGNIKEDKTVASRAVDMTRRLRNTLKHWYVFYNGYDPMFTWWVEKPYKRVDEALKEYRSLLREQVVGIGKDETDEPVIGNPIGRETLLSELAYAMIPYTPEELIKAGKREFEWCQAEMIKASKELGYGEDWLEAMEYVKTLHMDPGEQPYLIRDQAVEAIEFLEKHELITIPDLARETWRIEMMSPERQKVNPFFTGGEIIHVSFPTNTMSHEQKLMSMRGNNIHFARATVHHELIPGHHMQGFMTRRFKPFRRIFATPFWLEGWALHWEMLLWDLEFPQSPENRIGMLFWRMHRCARIIFSLSFHLGKMTPQECIDMLVSQVGHELANATGEVRRSFAGDYPPLYQAAYMLGGLQIRALYHELVTSGKMTSRNFHDSILRENSIPIEILRARLTQQKLTEDFKSSWRFLDK